ncbi:MAG: MATE family efflux transporter [Pseudomonadota bacterium]
MSPPPPTADPAADPGADRAAAPGGRALTTATVLAIATPVVLSNAAVPLQGAIDTAIMGNTGDATLLAAVTLGAAAVVMAFASCNFLQTGISGTTAQALGAANPERAANTLLRGLIAAGAIALVFILAAGPFTTAALWLFEAPAGVDGPAATYVRLRLWGAPFELANYAVLGWFAGQGLTGRLFALQLAVSGVNVAATLGLVLGLGLGIEGVALGTVIGHAAGAAAGLAVARARLRALVPAGWRPRRARLFAAVEIAALARLNRDLFLRTLMVAFAFAWVARLGAMQGETVLAANGVLMQFFAVTTAALDGFAIAAESLVGRAVGARSRDGLRRAVLVSARAAALLALALSLVLYAAAGPIVAAFTDIEAVRTIAMAHVGWAAFIPLAGVAAFMLDGTFIGAADGRSMRNAMALSVALFLPAGWLATEMLGNHAMWASVWGFLILRAVTLGALYPALEARVGSHAPGPPAPGG